MAKPIKNTPILYGKDAEAFLLNMSCVPNKIDKEKEQKRIEKSLDDLKSLLRELDIK